MNRDPDRADSAPPGSAQSTNVLDLELDESVSRPGQPLPLTKDRLREWVQTRLRLYGTALPEGFQLPSGITLDDLLPPNPSAQ
jgi:hypothetical protein